MGPVNVSSCEGFLLMMKQVPGCKLVGAASYGASGNPQPADLGNGVTVFLPSWRGMGPDGVCFEGKGLAPDVAVKAAPDALRSRDPVLAAGLKWVRE
jgi:C-terminal processing protease CtpA/Prc